MRFTVIYYDGDQTRALVADTDGPYDLETKLGPVLEEKGKTFEHIEAVHEVPDNCRPILNNPEGVDSNTEYPAIILSDDETFEGGADEHTYLELIDLRLVQPA